MALLSLAATGTALGVCPDLGDDQPGQASARVSGSAAAAQNMSVDATESRTGKQSRNATESGTASNVQQSGDEEESSRSFTLNAVFGAAPNAGNAFTYSQRLVPSGATVIVSGSATGTVSDRGSEMSVSMEVEGLPPNRSFGAHVHREACSADPGKAGPHFQNINGLSREANEIWLDFRTNRTGTGTAFAARSFALAPEQAPRSVVIHSQGTNPQTGDAGTRAACVTVPFSQLLEGGERVSDEGDEPGTGAGRADQSGTNRSAAGSAPSNRGAGTRAPGAGTARPSTTAADDPDDVVAPERRVAVPTLPPSAVPPAAPGRSDANGPPAQARAGQGRPEQGRAEPVPPEQAGPPPRPPDQPPRLPPAPRMNLPSMEPNDIEPGRITGGQSGALPVSQT